MTASLPDEAACSHRPPAQHRFPRDLSASVACPVSEGLSLSVTRPRLHQTRAGAMPPTPPTGTFLRAEPMPPCSSPPHAHALGQVSTCGWSRQGCTSSRNAGSSSLPRLQTWAPRGGLLRVGQGSGVPRCRLEAGRGRKPIPAFVGQSLLGGWRRQERKGLLSRTKAGQNWDRPEPGLLTRASRGSGWEPAQLRLAWTPALPLW